MSGLSRYAVTVRLVVLPKKILPVVITIGGANDHMDVLARGLFRVGGEANQISGSLVVEFDQHHRAMNAVVEYAVSFRPAYPRKPGVVEVTFDFLHLNPRVTVIHVADVEAGKLHQLPVLPRR